MNILLVCERSAGHIFPALCFAKKLSKASNQIYFFLTSASLKKYVEDKGFAVLGKNLPFRNLIIEGVWRFFESLYIIFKLRPRKVIGFGGRDSFFLLLFSSFLLLDTIIYEPNLNPGKANKVLRLFVRGVWRGFESGSQTKKTKTIGVPLRENIRKIDKQKARQLLNLDDKLLIFCFGGSQGASFINSVFIKFVQSCDKDFQIIHLTGKDHYFKIMQLYNKINNNKFVKDFYYDMEVLYSAADIVVSRSGANTLAEIAFYGLPSLLIPHPLGGAHQKENAFYFRERGAAFVCLQNNFSFSEFSSKLEELIGNENLRRKMSTKVAAINLGVSFENFYNSTYF